MGKIVSFNFKGKTVEQKSIALAILRPDLPMDRLQQLAGGIVFDHIWFWRKRLPERKGQQCRILVRGSMNSILVEFEDGFEVVTSRWAVRRTEDFSTTNKAENRLQTSGVCDGDGTIP
jgi:hypothetical protein